MTSNIYLKTLKYSILIVFIYMQSSCTNSKKKLVELPSTIVEKNISIKGKKIGYSFPSLNAPFYKALLASIQSNAELNHMKLIYANAEDNPQKQIDDINEMIYQGIDVLLLNPKDPNTIVAATKNAHDLGIPIFIVDSSIEYTDDKIITTLQANNYENGKLVGEWLVEKKGNNPMNIALLSGVKGNPVGKTRKKGVIEGITARQLTNYGQINLKIKTQQFTNWTYEGGKNAVKNILANHPDINVIIAESDVSILGAIDELKKAGKTNDILIATAADGQKEALKYIMDTEFYGCTAMNSPTQIGKAAIIFAIQYLKGKRNFSKKSYTPPMLITKENALDYYDPKAIF